MGDLLFCPHCLELLRFRVGMRPTAMSPGELVAACDADPTLLSKIFAAREVASTQREMMK